MGIHVRARRGWVAGLIAATLLATAGCGTSSKKEDANGSESMAMADQAFTKQKLESVDSKNTAAASGAAPAAVAVKGQAAGNQMAAAPPAVPNSGFNGVPDAGDGLSRKLIYKANLTMKVKDYGKAQSDIRDLVAISGGYILSFSEGQSNHETGGSFVLKLPAAGFSSFLKELEKVPHENMQRNVQGQDVSEEYVDLQSRLKAKQVEESRYLEFMQKAGKTDELIAFSKELGRIQEEIERYKGRMRYIDQNVSFSTVELRVYQPGPLASKHDPEEAATLWGKASKAMKDSFGFLTSFVEALIVFLAWFLPIAAAVAIPGVPIWLAIRRWKAKAAVREEEARRLRMEMNRTERPIAGEVENSEGISPKTEDSPSAPSE